MKINIKTELWQNEENLRKALTGQLWIIGLTSAVNIALTMSYRIWFLVALNGITLLLSIMGVSSHIKWEREKGATPPKTEGSPQDERRKRNKNPTQKI